MHSHHRPVRLSHVSSPSRHPRTLWPCSYPARPAFPHDSRHRMVRGARVRARVAALPRASPTCLIHMLSVSPTASRSCARMAARTNERTNDVSPAQDALSLCPLPMLPHAIHIPHSASHPTRLLTSFYAFDAFALHSPFFHVASHCTVYFFHHASHSSPHHTSSYASSRIYPAPARTSFLRTLHVASHWLSAWWGA